MISRVVGKRGKRLRGMLLVTLSLVMLLTSMAPVQARQQSPAERLDLVPEDCEIPEHRPGEFRVYYDSEAALRAAPEENVVEETAVNGPGGGVFEQRLVFEEIKKEPGPEKRRVMEEVEKRKLEGRSGVTHVGYVWAGGGSCEGHPDELVLQSRQKLFEYICSPEGLEELFGKDDDAQRRLCEDREPDPEACAPKERPGELMVYYKSEEDAPAVPKENVVVVEEAVVIRGGPPRFGPPPLGSGPPGSGPPSFGPPSSGPPSSGPPGSGEEFFMQHLLFKEIKDEKDPDKQRAAHEAKKWELLEQWPGVVDVEGLLETPQGEECIGSRVSRVLLYVCSPEGLEKVFWGDVDLQRWLCGPMGGGGNNCYPNCNKGIVERARKIIGGGRSDAGGGASGKDGGKAREKAGGRLAFDAAFEGIRSAGGRSVSASEEDPGTVAEGSGDEGSIPARSGEAGSGTAQKVADAKSGSAKKAADDDEPDEEVNLDDGGSGGGGARPEESRGAKETAGAGPDEEATGAAGSAAGGGGETEGPNQPDTGEEAEDIDAGEEDATAGDVAPGYMTPRDTAPGGTAPGDGASGGAAPGDTAPGDTAPGGAASGDDGDGMLGFLSDPLNGTGNGDPEGEDVELGVAENVAATSKNYATGGSSALILGSIALLAAGVFAVRRILRG